tara:strand:- start:1780 stop:1974 length:195 start_codon:yes stop_codon:yes gene_type:complete
MKDKKLLEATDKMIQKRREYMKKYYRKKKAERIKKGTCVSICRGHLPVNKNFKIERGEFTLSFF